MKITFACDFDGILQLEPGDRLEIQLLNEFEDKWRVSIIRQTGVRPAPPDLGVSVTDSMGISDRLG